MRKTFWVGVLPFIILFLSCNADNSTESDSYKEMKSKYTLLTVSQLWSAMTSGTSDYDGTYLLVQGGLLSVGTNTVTLIDTTTDKAVTTEFEESIDLTTLKNVLSNNTDSTASYTVTIGGICHYYEDTTSYPYLDSCDYFYVNDDA